jgi:K+ transporter
MAQAAAAHGTEEGQTTRDRHVWALALGSIGVVFGDIGTSPLYALREAVKASSGGPDAVARHPVHRGVDDVAHRHAQSMCWSYSTPTTRAKGTFALMALGQSVAKRSSSLLLVLGVIGAAFFYGDAVLTPAISVLSAVEGLKLVAPQSEHTVVLLTIVILVGLFAVQSHGTAKVAQYFGPVMLVWFAALAAGGLVHIIDDPRVFLALNPVLGVQFILTHGMVGLVVMGLVFLAVTGAEALYADLGHFGRKPIQLAWLVLVQPALILNYFGQGALLLAHPEAIDNPFYRLYPSWALIPMVVLATVATVIASQAVIWCLLLHAAGHSARASAASRHSPHVAEHRRPDLLAARQSAAVRRRAARDPYLPQLQRARRSLRPVGHRNDGRRQPHGFLRRLEVLGLARLEGGVADGSAAAGRASFPRRQRAQDSRRWLASAGDRPGDHAPRSHLGARLGEPGKGDAQERGRAGMAGAQARGQAPASGARNGVFLTGDPVRRSLANNLKHNRVLHERNIILTIKTEDTPRVPATSASRSTAWRNTFIRVIAHPASWNAERAEILEHCRRKDLSIDVSATSFFLSRRSLRTTMKSEMPLAGAALHLAGGSSGGCHRILPHLATVWSRSVRR